MNTKGLVQFIFSLIVICGMVLSTAPQPEPVLAQTPALEKTTLAENKIPLEKEKTPPSEVPLSGPASAPVPEAEEVACNNPPSGQQVQLFSEDEVIVAFRDEEGHWQGNWFDNQSGDLDYTDAYRFTGPSSDIHWLAVTTGDLNGDRRDEVISAYRDADKQIKVATKGQSGSDFWYSDYGQLQGDIEYIDVATGNLNRSSDGDDEVVVALADDGHDIRVFVLDGDAHGGIRHNPNYVLDNWWYPGSDYGRGNVSHIAVATGDLNGNGYDDEIVVAFKDGNKDLQIIVFKRKSGDLQIVYEKQWQNNDRDNIAKHGTRGLDVTTGDIDGNYKDEIILTFADKSNKVQVLSLRYTGKKSDGTYRFNDDVYTQITPQAQYLLDIDQGVSYDGWPWYLSAAAGDIDGDGQDEIAVGYTCYHGWDFVSAWHRMVALVRYPVLRTLDYKSSSITGMPGTLVVKNTWSSASINKSTRWYVDDVTVAMGDLNQNGKDEILMAFTDEWDDLQLRAFNKNLTVRDSWENRNHYRDTVKYAGVAVGDFDANALYGQYSGNCREVTEAHITAIVHTPPRWAGINDGSSLYAGYGKSYEFATSDSQKMVDSYGGSVTLDAGLSFDVVQLGASSTYEWQQSIANTWSEGSSRSVTVGQGSDNYTADPVVFTEVTYQCYKYREYVGNSPQNAYMRVCVPFETRPRGPDLAKWNATHVTESGDSWVPLGRCSHRPDLAPTAIRDPDPDDGQFQMQINGIWHDVAGNVLWTWGDLSNSGIPSEKGSSFLVRTAEDVPKWSLSEAQSFSHSVEDTYSYNETVGGSAKVLGIGGSGSASWGFEEGTSHTQSWSESFYMEGDAPGLPQGTSAGKQYAYVPYYYEQSQISSTGVEQNYFVVDYYVPEPPAADPFNNGLVGWWRGEGQVINEVGAPGACYGTLNGGMDYDTGFAPGQVGLAFQLDGSDDYVNASNGIGFHPAQLTLSAWVKGDPAPPGLTQWIVGKRDAWNLWRNTYDNSVNLTLAGPYTVPGASNSLSAGVWHHVVAVLDGSKAYLYVDGQLDVAAPANVPDSDLNIFIGGYARSHLYNDNFDGLIDEVRLYNYALSSAEIQSLYQKEKAGIQSFRLEETTALAPELAPQTPLVDSPTHPDPDAWYDAANATFTWQQPAGDPADVSGYRWYLDHSSATVPIPFSQGLTSTVTFEDLADGVWVLHVRAGDTDGAWSDTAHRTVRVDTQPPQVKLTLDPPLPTGNSGWYNTPLTVTVAATDTAGSDVGTIEVSTDKITWQPYTAPLTYITDTMTTTVWARATDLTGHTATPVSTTFKIDVTPPSSKVEIGSATLGLWVAHVITDTLGNQQLVLGGSFTDTLSGVAGMNLQANEDEWTSASALGKWHPFPSQPEVTVNWYYTATSELGRGAHIFYGAAQDQAGNLETPYPLGQVVWMPPDHPELAASSLAVTPQTARPGQVVTFTLALRNTGRQEAHVAVTDTLPAGLTLITDTLAPELDYDPATGVVAWPAQLLWPGNWAKYTFQARVDDGLSATTLESQAQAHAFWPTAAPLTPAQRTYFQAHEDRVTLSAMVKIDPDLPPDADVLPPQAHLATVSGQVTDQQEVGLGISAGPGAHWMYLREWTPDPLSGAWTVAQEKGWLPYTPAYTWTLSAGEGVKYLGVWVADRAGNISRLDEGSLAYTNLVNAGRSLDAGGRAQYRFDPALESLIIFQLLAYQGDVDLYVWNPLNAFRPNHAGENTTMADVVAFWVTETGRYLVEALARSDGQYSLTASGLEVSDMEAQRTSVSADKERPGHPLTISDPLSAGSHLTPPPLDGHEVFLPLVMRGTAD